MVLVDELMTLTEARTKTDAVVAAVRDEIRFRKAARIKAMAGKMEFMTDSDSLRHGDPRLG
jgi:hypothetical protein